MKKSKLPDDVVSVLIETSKAYRGIADFEGTGENMTPIIHQIRGILERYGILAEKDLRKTKDADSVRVDALVSADFVRRLFDYIDVAIAERIYKHEADEHNIATNFDFLDRTKREIVDDLLNKKALTQSSAAPLLRRLNEFISLL
ncbi:MAG: hypothetical protein ACE5IR_08355 [bacterium]